MTTDGNFTDKWTVAPLRDLIVFMTGGDWGQSLDHSDPNYVQVLCIRASEVRNWATDKGATAALRRVKPSSLHTRQLQKGDIVIEISGGGPEQPVGRTLLIDDACLATNAAIPKICTNFFRLMRPSTGVHAPYLNVFLQHFYCCKDMSRYQGGSNNLRNLKFDEYLTIEVPIPPLAEQHRIVAKIEELFSELDKGVESLTTAREQLKVYRQAVLKHAFEGKLTADWRAKNPDKLETPEALLSRIRRERERRYAEALQDWQRAIAEWRAGGEVGDQPARPRKPKDVQPRQRERPPGSNVPDCWAISLLGNLDVQVFDGPFGSNLKTSDYVELGVRVVRLENIGHGRFIDAKRSFVSEEKYETLKKHTVLPGDIVFSSFVTDTLRSAIVPISIPFALNKADCFGIRLFGCRVSPRFVQLFLQSRNAFKQVEGMIHGVGRPRINTGQLSELAIPTCPPEEQAIVVETLERVTSEIEDMESGIETVLDQVAALRQSILKQAFSGQLVTQDQNDEPASVLLERIRAERQQSNSGPKKSKKREKAVAV